MGEIVTSFWAEYGSILLEGIRDTLIMTGVSTVLAYLHVSPYGVHSGYIHAENHDPAGFNEAEIIKKALKRAVEIADHVSALAGKQFIVDVHYDNLP